MKKIFRKEVVIGLSVVLAIAILFFGIEFLKGKSIFKPANYYYAFYSDVKGLSQSAPVIINGVKVGLVDEVSIYPKDPSKVLVQFSIDRSLKIPVGSKVVLDNDLLGTASLRIDMQISTSNVYHPGDTLPASVYSGLMDKVSHEIMPQLEAIAPRIDTLLINLNNITGNPAINATLTNLQVVTDQMKTTVSLLNTSAGKLPDLLGDVKGVVANVDSISAGLKRLSANLADAPIEETMANINLISKRLADVTAQINDPDTNLGKLLHGTELYDNLTRATADMDSLLVDIKKNPKRYISIKLL